MSGLTREERGRMVKGFLMTSGGIALAMVLFALIGHLDLAAVIVAVVGMAMAVVSPVLWLLHHPARVVYGVMVIGLAVVAGAVGGYVIGTVTSVFH